MSSKARPVTVLKLAPVPELRRLLGHVEGLARPHAAAELRDAHDSVEGEGERDSVGAGDGAVAAAAQELRALVRAARVGREAVVVGCAAEEAVAVADHEVGLSTELVDVLHLELARRGAARHLGVDGAAGQAGADQRHVLVVGEGAVAAHTQADLQVGEAAGARRADEVAVLAEAGVAHDPVFLVRSDGHGGNYGALQQDCGQAL
mmetsp:Transcript_11506/g.42956  ORF Transcript_11506/g.42956 Transcript_11506/m.42956 type:complete len:205 (-) Transcript_11506:37-651(-)